MEDRLTALQARLTELEGRARRGRRYAAAGIALALLLGTTAAVAPSLCDTVRAERFVLTDADGRERLRINAYGSETATLQLFDPSGRELAGLAWANGVRFDFKDRAGVSASALRIDADGRAYFEQRLQSAQPVAAKPGPGGECDHQYRGPGPAPGELTGPR